MEQFPYVYSPMTRGMQVQAAENTRAILEIQGDLKAISLLREISRRPMKCSLGRAPDTTAELDMVINGVTFQAKKKLWNAQSRLISRVTAKLFRYEDPNSLESIVARELIGLASYGVE